jgi:hypothetical protein
MYRVEWLQSALDDLAAVWLQADSALRQAITAASNLIDQQLQHDSQNQGESRSDGRRILFAPPLGVSPGQEVAHRVESQRMNAEICGPSGRVVGRFVPLGVDLS